MKYTISGFVTYDKYDWETTPRIGFITFSPELLSCGMVAVKAHSFEVDVPDDFDPRAMQVAQLEAEKNKIRAEFAKRVAEVDAAIANLLSIENAAL